MISITEGGYTAFENEKEYKSYIRGMDQYIEKLKKMRKDNPGQAKRKALESLVESGVFNDDGTPKKKICD